jgi:predicted N-formylglutamate amidohydrolase
LRSHRGLDVGAIFVAKRLQDKLGAPLLYSTVSRLLIDLNRPLMADGLHSKWTAPLKESGRRSLERQFHQPYWRRARQQAKRLIKTRGLAIHFSIHSFTPVLRGARRACHIGLLFDPRRSLEASVAAKLQKTLKKEFPRYKIRLNYPYRGASPGLTQSLRADFSELSYCGIEIELNQALLREKVKSAQFRQNLADRLASALDQALPTTVPSVKLIKGSKK